VVFSHRQKGPFVRLSRGNFHNVLNWCEWPFAGAARNKFDRPVGDAVPGQLGALLAAFVLLLFRLWGKKATPGACGIITVHISQRLRAREMNFGTRALHQDATKYEILYNIFRGVCEEARLTLTPSTPSPYIRSKTSITRPLGVDIFSGRARTTFERMRPVAGGMRTFNHFPTCQSQDAAGN
jgi:hypothetical protein